MSHSSKTVENSILDVKMERGIANRSSYVFNRNKWPIISEVGFIAMLMLPDCTF